MRLPCAEPTPSGAHYRMRRMPYRGFHSRCLGPAESFDGGAEIVCSGWSHVTSARFALAIKSPHAAVEAGSLSRNLSGQTRHTLEGCAMRPFHTQSRDAGAVVWRMPPWREATLPRAADHQGRIAAGLNAPCSGTVPEGAGRTKLTALRTLVEKPCSESEPLPNAVRRRCRSSDPSVERETTGRMPQTKKPTGLRVGF